MLKKLTLLFFISIFMCSTANALVEIGGEYSYSKKVYGANRESDITSSTSAGSLLFFIFNFFAIELNYSKSKQKRNELPNITYADTTLTLTKYQNTVLSEAWGAGVRFSLAHRKALIRPDISIGYANQTITDSSLYTIYDSSDSSTSVEPGRTSNYKSDSVFGGFTLNFRLSQRLKFKTAIKTIFPAFEWNQAKDYLKYSVGFSWIL